MLVNDFYLFISCSTYVLLEFWYLFIDYPLVDSLFKVWCTLIFHSIESSLRKKKKNVMKSYDLWLILSRDTFWGKNINWLLAKTSWEIIQQIIFLIWDFFLVEFEPDINSDLEAWTSQSACGTVVPGWSILY